MPIPNQNNPSDILCQACNSSCNIVFSKISKYNAVKCKGCGLVQTLPAPSEGEIVDYYQNFQFQASDLRFILTQIPDVAASLKHLINSPLENLSFLDYGGGCGIYSVAAKSLGMNVTLFDYDRSAIEFASQELGVDDACFRWEQVEGKKFDIIFAYHVVEHWREIDSNIAMLCSTLKDQGMLLFVTPNARSLEKWARPSHFLNYFKKWSRRGISFMNQVRLLIPTDSYFCWDPPRHLFAFTDESFEAIGKKYRFDTEIIIGYNVDKLYEPRSYVVPQASLWKALAYARRLKFREAWQIAFKAFSCIALKFLSFFFPQNGDQLIVKFTKNKILT